MTSYRHTGVLLLDQIISGAYDIDCIDCIPSFTSRFVSIKENPAILAAPIRRISPIRRREILCIIHFLIKEIWGKLEP